jgi:hypothetical protein
MQKLPEIHLQPLKRGYWSVEKDYTYEIKLRNGNRLFGVVPAGYVCDLDSVPRLPVFYGWLKNRTVVAAIIHDWLCYVDTPKTIADEAFLIAMEMEGVRYRYRYPIYWGVKYFGKAYTDLKQK